MANERMYLRCRGCGEEIMIAKRLYSEPFAVNDADALDAFFEKHQWHNGGNQPDDQCLQDFELHYESETTDGNQHDGNTPTPEQIMAQFKYIADNIHFCDTCPYTKKCDEFRAMTNQHLCKFMAKR